MKCLYSTAEMLSEQKKETDSDYQKQTFVLLSMSQKLSGRYALEFVRKSSKLQ